MEMSMFSLLHSRRRYYWVSWSKHRRRKSRKQFHM